MDSLGVERFVTWGISGGAPHALACGALLGGRVAAVASLGGIAPFDAVGLNYFRDMGADNLVEFGLAMAGQEHLEAFLRVQADQMSQAGGTEIAEAIASLVSPQDQEVLDGGLGAFWASALRGVFQGGVAGWVEDDLAFVKDFGFDVHEISVPVLVVHGEQDRFVPPDHGHWLAAAIPGAERWINADDGHLTLIANGVPAVHEWLLGHL
jgi:pimeloyl-ACP methyl ester carboxylesterase